LDECLHDPASCTSNKCVYRCGNIKWRGTDCNCSSNQPVGSVSDYDLSIDEQRSNNWTGCTCAHSSKHTEGVKIGTVTVISRIGVKFIGKQREQCKDN
jgi:hypothetical protein